MNSLVINHINNRIKVRHIDLVAPTLCFYAPSTGLSSSRAQGHAATPRGLNGALKSPQAEAPVPCGGN